MFWFIISADNIIIEMDKKAQYDTTYEIPTVQRIYMINGNVFLGGTQRERGWFCTFDYV